MKAKQLGLGLILVSNRENSLRLCDRILFLQKGVIEDSGSFTELSLRHPAYLNT